MANMGELRENLPSARPAILKIGQNMANIPTSRRKNRVQASCGRRDGGRLGGVPAAVKLPQCLRRIVRQAGRRPAWAGARPVRQDGRSGKAEASASRDVREWRLQKKKARPHRVLRRPPLRLGQACQWLPAGLLPFPSQRCRARLGQACQWLPRLVDRIGAAAGCRSVPAAALPGCRGLSIALAPRLAAYGHVSRSGMAVRAPEAAAPHPRQVRPAAHLARQRGPIQAGRISPLPPAPPPQACVPRGFVRPPPPALPAASSCRVRRHPDVARNAARFAMRAGSIIIKARARPRVTISASGFLHAGFLHAGKPQASSTANRRPAARRRPPGHAVFACGIAGPCAARRRRFRFPFGRCLPGTLLVRTTLSRLPALQ